MASNEEACSKSVTELVGVNSSATRLDDNARWTLTGRGWLKGMERIFVKDGLVFHAEFIETRASLEVFHPKKQRASYGHGEIKRNRSLLHPLQRGWPRVYADKLKFRLRKKCDLCHGLPESSPEEGKNLKKVL